MFHKCSLRGTGFLHRDICDQQLALGRKFLVRKWSSSFKILIVVSSIFCFPRFFMSMGLFMLPSCTHKSNTGVNFLLSFFSRHLLYFINYICNRFPISTSGKCNSLRLLSGRTSWSAVLPFQGSHIGIACDWRLWWQITSWRFKAEFLLRHDSCKY